jgi:cell division protein FtsB
MSLGRWSPLPKPLSWLEPRQEVRKHPRDRDSRSQRARLAAFACEALESRVVLSDWGGGNSLASALSYVGVVTGPVEVGGHAGHEHDDHGSQSSQLPTDIQALQTKLQTLAAKSALTIADISNLAADSGAIQSAGFSIDFANLKKAVSELASAVASGSSTSQAQTDFNNLFSGSSVSQTVIDKAFSDLVQAITDSKVTATDLSTVAADEAAIQNDHASQSGGDDSDAGGFSSGDNSYSGSLAAALNDVGVVTRATASASSGDCESEGSRSGSNSTSQLQTDVQTLNAELQTLAAKSGVTVSDVSHLSSDSQAIASAGFTINHGNLKTVVSELASAVASGSSTSQAQTDFNNLFSGSSVSQTVIDKAFSDLVQAITDSKVTTTDLSPVAADQAAIQNDLSSLQDSSGSDNAGGDCSGSSNSSGSSGSTSSGSSTSTTTTTSATTASATVRSSSGSTSSTTTGTTARSHHHHASSLHVLRALARRRRR